MANAILIIELLLRFGPAVAKAAKTILETEKPTPAQWDALWQLTKEPFNSNVPQVPEK